MPGCYKQSGHVYLNGSRVRELGVNCPDLFHKWISTNGGPSSATPVVYTTPAVYTAAMDDMVARGLRFVRFLVTGFRTKSYRVGFYENPTSFFTNLDALVAAAEARGILLVPSLFFSIPCLPPLFGENLNAYGNPASLTYAEVVRATTSIVNRYKNSSAIAYWEFANEADARTAFPKTVPSYSTDTTMEQPAAWTTADSWDEFTSNTITTAFHNTCKAADPTRLTASGGQGWRYASAVKQDMLSFVKLRLQDDATDSLTLHPYETHGFHNTAYQGLSGFLRVVKANMEPLNKPVIVGEFGCSNIYSAGGRTGVQVFQYVLDNIMDADVDVAMAWSMSANSDVDNAWYYNTSGNLNVAYLTALTQAQAKYRL